MGPLELLIALLTAHLIGDFILQTDDMVRVKRNPAILVAHAGVVMVLTLILTGGLNVVFLLSVLILHLLVDATKVYALGDKLPAFIIDQGFHLVVILALVRLFPNVFAEGWWPALFSPMELEAYLVFLTMTGGLILGIPAGGIIVGKFTATFANEIGEEVAVGLRDGGKVIGYLERALVMLLIFLNQPAGVGFLIATKSILRFGEIRTGEQRKVAEYIIIGTFLSFGWAILTGALTWGTIHLLLS